MGNSQFGGPGLKTGGPVWGGEDSQFGGSQYKRRSQFEGASPIWRGGNSQFGGKNPQFGGPSLKERPRFGGSQFTEPPPVWGNPQFELSPLSRTPQFPILEGKHPQISRVPPQKTRPAPLRLSPPSHSSYSAPWRPGGLPAFFPSSPAPSLRPRSGLSA